MSMKAYVKAMKRESRVSTPGHTDRFCIPEMLSKKPINVEPLLNAPGWFVSISKKAWTTKHGWYYHRRWLIFKKGGKP